jgi:hypothetical protein
VSGGRAATSAIPPFPAGANVRASFAAGSLYAVDGGEGWIYYAQVAPTRDFGFFRFRSRTTSESAAALASGLMCRIGVDYPSVGEALRTGKWLKLRKTESHPELQLPNVYVQWPIGTHEVMVWTVRAIGFSRRRSIETYETTIDDPAIQNLEIAASWHAVHHIPERLKADFGTEIAAWYVGGPVWRERRVAAELARRHPDQPNHQDRKRTAMLRSDH